MRLDHRKSLGTKKEWFGNTLDLRPLVFLFLPFSVKQEEATKGGPRLPEAESVFSCVLTCHMDTGGALLHTWVSHPRQRQSVLNLHVHISPDTLGHAL